jgi:hypothetical protein
MFGVRNNSINFSDNVTGHYLDIKLTVTGLYLDVKPIT